MEKLMEKFRGGVIAIAVAVIALVACVCLFNSTASAESNEDPSWEGNNYALNESYLTCNVQAPRNATFDATFTYTFTYDSAGTYGGKTDGTYAISEQSVHTKANVGDWDGASKTEKWIYNNPHGPGKESGGSADWDDTASLYGYIAQLGLDNFISASELVAACPSNGMYVWTVKQTMTSPTDAETVAKYDVSDSLYTFRVWIGEEIAGDRSILGCTFYQHNDDKPGSTVYVPKKNPTLSYGNSNYQYAVDPTEAPDPVTVGGAVYEGFTFKNEYAKVESTYDNLYIGKTVTGVLGDRNLPFTFQDMKLTCSNWNELDVETLTAHIITGETTVTNYDSIVTFTITKGTGGAPASAVTSEFTLKDGQKLVFDGATRTNGAGQSPSVSSKLPVGTYYQYTEKGTTGYVPKATTTTSQIDATHVTPGTLGENLTEQYIPTVGSGQNLYPIVGETTASAPSINSSVVTNDCNDSPTGFLIDALPYALMIGIPILALIIWIVVRKRRATKQF